MDDNTYFNTSKNHFKHTTIEIMTIIDNFVPSKKEIPLRCLEMRFRGI